ERRERTSAYSAITKNAFTATSTAARVSLSPFTPQRRSKRREDALGARPARVERGAPGPSGPCYFEEVLRRRSSHPDPPKVASESVEGGPKWKGRRRAGGRRFSEARRSGLPGRSRPPSGRPRSGWRASAERCSNRGRGCLGGGSPPPPARPLD